MSFSQQARAASPVAYPEKWTTAILVASVCYLSLLSFVNAHGIRVSSALTALCEALIYLGCLGVLVRRLPAATVAFACFACSWVVFTWLIRQGIDVKSLRDLIIPILFLSLGRNVADVGFADRSLKLIVLIVAALGLFEVVFIDEYSKLFNTFSFYVNTGAIDGDHAMYRGQMLTLNGFRPEGIGRTILPFLLGAHRASSVLMEPVGLGNFAVIVLAWTLSKPWQDLRKCYLLLAAPVFLIVLCDSRFGLLMSAVVIATRFVPAKILGRFVPMLPFGALALVIAVALFIPSTGDNLIGRVTRSGLELLHFDWLQVLGLGASLPDYGDMGYAYALSRFGAPLLIALVIALFIVPMPSKQGIRFRALVILYIFASLAISGTSVFALKTAGVMWFLFGVISATQDIPEQPATGSHTSPLNERSTSLR